MTVLASALLAGAGVGLAVAAPVGPMSLLCVQRTLALGVAAGVATGLGAATVHVAYGSIALLGARSLAMPPIGAGLVPLASGLILFWFAARTLRGASTLAGRPAAQGTLVSAYCGAVGLGVLNPLTLLLFAAALPALIGAGDEQAVPALVAGVFLGSLAWWLVLSAGVALLRARLSPTVLDLTNRAAGVGLAALATTILARAYGPLL